MVGDNPSAPTPSHPQLLSCRLQPEWTHVMSDALPHPRAGTVAPLQLGSSHPTGFSHLLGPGYFQDPGVAQVAPSSDTCDHIPGLPCGSLQMRQHESSLTSGVLCTQPRSSQGPKGAHLSVTTWQPAHSCSKNHKC